jgi:hypothetical protein
MAWRNVEGSAMRRIAATTLGICLLLGACGCLMPFGIAYPTVSYTPSVATGADAGEVRAFRVDFVESRHSLNQAEWLKCEFQEIDMSSRNEVPSQLTTGISYAWALYFFPGTVESYKGSLRSHDEWVRVRLYRRGFKTIELGPDDSGDMRLDWLLVADNADREEAIDKLVGAQKDFLGHLFPGSKSPKHNAFLRFAADEYQNLANSLDDNNAAQAKLRVHLLKKIKDLRLIAASTNIPETAKR